MQTQEFFNNSVNSAGNTTVNLTSSSNTGRFDASASGPFNGEVTSVTILAGSSSAGFFYKDSTVGTPTITATAAGFSSISQQETVVAAGGNGSGGGGGGGAGGGGPALKIKGIGKVGWYTSVAGIISADIEVESEDGLARAVATQGSIITDGAGKAVSNMTCYLASALAPVPPDKKAIAVYDFGPPEATFNPAATIAIKYDPLEIPAGENEETIVIAYYDGANGKWVDLYNISIDTIKKTISGKTNHFGQVTVLVSQPVATPSLQSDATPAPEVQNIPVVSDSSPAPEKPVEIPVLPTTSTDLKQAPNPLHGSDSLTEQDTLAAGGLVTRIAVSVAIGLVIGLFALAFSLIRRIHLIFFTTRIFIVTIEDVSPLIIIQMKNWRGKILTMEKGTEIELSSTSPTGKFDISPSGKFDGSVKSLIISRGSLYASFYYKDSTRGYYEISAKRKGQLNWKIGTQKIWITDLKRTR